MASGLVDIRDASMRAAPNPGNQENCDQKNGKKWPNRARHHDFQHREAQSAANDQPRKSCTNQNFHGGRVYSDRGSDQALVADLIWERYEGLPRQDFLSLLPGWTFDMNLQRALEHSRTKMQAARMGEPAINSFLGNLQRVASGETGLIPEASIQPVASLPSLKDLPPASETASALLSQLAVIKLNGGLGTGMGLDKAKSLVTIRDGWNFLDFTARQILHLRSQPGGSALAFLLMNSFNTQADTLAHLQRYPTLALGSPLDFLQGKVPKLSAETLEPISWPDDPDQEWCPPGHGDLYPSLLGSGTLVRLLKAGIRYAFISNSDNLGASVDLRLLEHFAGSKVSFLMEVAERTSSDRKGGHLARRQSDQRLILRESAQCPSSDTESFQDISRHRFFNTNNLWIRLDDLHRALQALGGAIPLPLIRNEKTVDPRDASSPKVLQLETAMGAAIECFAESGALVVDRSRFAPVKTTADLLALRSDAYQVTPDFRLELIPARKGIPPEINLDSRYKLIAPFEEAFGAAVPSLAGCHRLSIQGAHKVEPGVICVGNVEWKNPDSTIRTIPAGTYGTAL